MKLFIASYRGVLLQFACLVFATGRIPPELAGYYTAREPLHSLFGDLAVSGPTKNVLQNETQVLPDLVISSRMPYKPPFVFLIVDPDTSTGASSANQSTVTLHTLVDNLSSSSYYAVNQSRLFTSTFSHLAPYIGPAQSTDEPSHNYTLFLFARPSGFNVPSQYQSFLTASSLVGRAGFPLGQFTTQLGLGQPIAAMYFRLKLAQAAKVSTSGAAAPNASPTAKVTRSATEAYSMPKQTMTGWSNATGDNSTIRYSEAAGRRFRADLVEKTGLVCFIVAAIFAFAA